MFKDLWKKLFTSPIQSSSYQATQFVWPADLPPIEECARKISKSFPSASVLITQDIEDQRDPMHSRLGQVLVRSTDEQWPLTPGGRRMIGLAQFNLTEAPYLPQTLKEFQFVAIYFPFDPHLTVDSQLYWLANVSNLVIRTYHDLDDLEPYKQVPEPYSEWTPKAGVFTEIADASGCWNAIDEWWISLGRTGKTPDAVVQLLCKELAGSGLHYQTKLGGLTAPSQNNGVAPVTIQIGSHADVGFMWGDAGCLFFFYEDGKWRFDWECY